MITQKIETALALIASTAFLICGTPAWAHGGGGGHFAGFAGRFGSMSGHDFGNMSGHEFGSSLGGESMSGMGAHRFSGGNSSALAQRFNEMGYSRNGGIGSDRLAGMRTGGASSDSREQSANRMQGSDANYGNVASRSAQFNNGNSANRADQYNNSNAANRANQLNNGNAANHYDQWKNNNDKNNGNFNNNTVNSDPNNSVNVNRAGSYYHPYAMAGAYDAGMNHGYNNNNGNYYPVWPYIGMPLIFDSMAIGAASSNKSNQPPVVVQQTTTSPAPQQHSQADAYTRADQTGRIMADSFIRELAAARAARFAQTAPAMQGQGQSAQAPVPQ